MYTTIVQKILHAKKMKGSILKELEKGIFINALHCPEPPEKVVKGLKVQKSKIQGWDMYTLQKPKRMCEKVILFLHGGAYIHGFTKYHWKFMASLVNESGCTIITPDYPLAPSSIYTETYELVEAVYQNIQSEHNPAELIFMGDSAGGGLAVGLAQKLMLEGKRIPDQLFLLSPWLDVTMTNPDIEKINPRDPFIEPVGLKRAAELYAGDKPLDYWMISPMYGQIIGLPTIHLYIGDRDILWPDALKFNEMCKASGIDITLHLYPRMVHDWMIITFLPQAKRAIREIAGIITHRNPS